MKTRVTFRVAPELAEALRDLPNQTSFVEQALREALREKCPACEGTGRVPKVSLRVSNFRSESLPPLKRDTALQLRNLVSLARRATATRIDLSAQRGGMGFVVSKGAEVILRGTLGKPGALLFLDPRSN